MNSEALRTIKQKILELSTVIDGKVCQQFGFRVRDVSLDKVINYLYTPKDSSSLAVTRILFGVAMLFDIAGERGGVAMMERWGNPLTCHFALLPSLKALSMPYMALVYAALWLGAAGITLGYKYRLSATSFTLCYWYLFLVEKSFWNNHSYLFGLVATLLSFTDANCFWSIDAVLNPSIKRDVVPYWNYFILKYQFFILYFMAGLKKGTAEWLTGYSVQNLSEHWVFDPFKLFLTVPQTDYLVVHWFVFAFDLTVAIWMMWGRTRHVAMILCALFHLMNSRLFSIGMFPWVCLATMPLFYPFNWPKMIGNSLKILFSNFRNQICKCIAFVRKVKHILQARNEVYVESLIKSNVSQVIDEKISDLKQDVIEKINEKDTLNEKDSLRNVSKDKNPETATSGEDLQQDSDETKTLGDNKVHLQNPSYEKDKHFKILTVVLVLFLILTQAFLPFSHFITQGYNNWTNGLYGYSWDMMVHTWDTNSVVVKIVDNDKNAEFYIDPYLYSLNDRWTRHGDMLHQYAQCIKDNLLSQAKINKKKSRNALSNNLSVYVDVWCSMNGRFTQRMFDPKQDLLNASWSPWKPMSYLMPLLDEALSWRGVLQDMRREVHSWHNASDVIFIADFPGYDQEMYISTDLSNVTLTILEGNVLYEPDVSQTTDGQSIQLTTGNQIKIKNGMFHKVLNIGETPVYYMYTFVNISDMHDYSKATALKLPIGRELIRQLNNIFIFLHIIIANILQILSQFTQCRGI